MLGRRRRAARVVVGRGARLACRTTRRSATGCQAPLAAHTIAQHVRAAYLGPRPGRAGAPRHHGVAVVGGCAGRHCRCCGRAGLWRAPGIGGGDRHGRGSGLHRDRLGRWRCRRRGDHRSGCPQRLAAPNALARAGRAGVAPVVLRHRAAGVDGARWRPLHGLGGEPRRAGCTLEPIANFGLGDGPCDAGLVPKVGPQRAVATLPQLQRTGSRMRWAFSVSSTEPSTGCNCSLPCSAHTDSRAP